MHRCAVQKLTNWHICQLSNTKGCLTRQQARDIGEALMHLCKTIMGSYNKCVNYNSDVMCAQLRHFHG